MMNRWISKILAIFTGSSRAGKPSTSFRQIHADEAAAMMEREQGYIILDVRRRDEYAVRHIPNALNIPNESIRKNEIPELPDKNQLIFVYCQSGARSKEASKKLAKLGYTNIVNFGGIRDWKGKKMETD